LQADQQGDQNQCYPTKHEWLTPAWLNGFGGRALDTDLHG
jgi:hypothetical protein